MAHLGPSLRRAKRSERPLARAAAALAASLALNALALWALTEAGAFQLRGKADPARVALAPIPASQWEANRAVAGAKPAPPQPPPPAPEASGRVVELSPEQKASEQPPDKAKFLSDRNTRVQKETVSRHAGNHPRLAQRPEAGADAPRRPAPTPPPGDPSAAAGGEKAGREGREGASGDRVALNRPGGALRLPELGDGGEGGRRKQGQRGPDLSLSSEALARIAGGPSMDGVGEGLEVGDETWLQSREFKYATFINRMRSEIGQAWYPRVRDAVRERDPDGRLYLYKERTVELGITIDTDGNVRDLSVLQSSSIEFFDRVAVASVRAAQPFPNPPRGMFQSDDQVRIPFFFTMYPAGGQALFWRPPAHP
jgi:TonB family protein